MKLQRNHETLGIEESKGQKRMIDILVKEAIVSHTTEMERYLESDVQVAIGEALERFETIKVRSMVLVLTESMCNYDGVTYYDYVLEGEIDYL